RSRALAQRSARGAACAHGGRRQGGRSQSVDHVEGRPHRHAHPAGEGTALASQVGLGLAPSERKLVFANLSDRLTATFRNLRGKGRLSEADIDATIREIRRALLDADVAVPVV